MSLSSSRRPSAGSRRRPTTVGSTRLSYVDSSISSSYSTSTCKASDCSPMSRSHPVTPRRQAKYATCSSNHGIRPPPPEQYLTPLQQKEVCIRHLRARLKENVERLQDRDSEIGELRMQLTRMQEDWIEEECHRIEAQLALKEAKKEIRQLQQAVETVRTNLGIRDPNQQEYNPGGLGAGRMGSRPGPSRSCGCSPAHTLTRSTTFTRFSSDTPSPAEHNGNVVVDRAGSTNQVAAPKGDGCTHLLLEAALLSEHLRPIQPTMPRSSTYEKLCSGETILPVSRPCHAFNSSCSCIAHAYLPHHHLFLHLPQEEVPPPCPSPPPPPPPPRPPPADEVSDKPGFRSQACSPTITWISEEGGGEELSMITTATSAVDTMLTESTPFSPPSTATSPAQLSYIAEAFPSESTRESTPATTITAVITTPQLQQPTRRLQPGEGPQEVVVVEVSEEHKRNGISTEGEEEEEEEQAAPQRSHWSRYFLIDLLAVAVPVVPTVAWLCRGAQRDTMPVYHMGSLLRGCCAVALHSLRRMGSARGRGPTGTSGATPI
ncbi:syntaphilin [Chanos chanos]|uniref:Syntaphilin n=1 Tax=Chanos chanos TaxID=29144 RepID=A0A6J2WB85_CHACN|nr:syntaphilin-like [Chanos chanos]